MPARVAVVTDSTSYLPTGVAEREGVTVVPLHVVIDGKSLAEDSQVDAGRVSRALTSGLPVTTSRPSAATFAEVYRRLADQGASAIVSLHLSAEMSGTVDSARTGARELGDGGPAVTVVDSRSLGLGLGFAAVAAARLAATGAPAQEVARLARHRALHSSVMVYVDTLEYLRRGGRIGSAQARLGSALSVKPLLHLVDGRLEPLDRVRTTERAVSRLIELAAQEAREAQETQECPVELAVHHLAAAGRAHEVAERLRELVPEPAALEIVEVGAVVGAHVGPGMVAVVISPVSAVG
jgi:DegV family protein with EDD domain